MNASVSRILAVSILLTAFMIAMAFPAVDLLLRGGAFHRADSATMALYFAIFSISLCLWSAQAIYARAFYAAGNTITPMVAGTLVTVASLPVYWSLYQSFGPAGLAIASDIGILIQTLTLAIASPPPHGSAARPRVPRAVPLPPGRHRQLRSFSPECPFLPLDQPPARAAATSRRVCSPYADRHRRPSSSSGSALPISFCPFL